jgi:hypothetical protein
VTALDAPIPQNLRALADANRVRLARAATKQDIADGETTVAAILADPPEHVATMTIYNLLRAQHGWAGSRTRRLLKRVNIGEHRAVGALTERQRGELVDHLAPEPVAVYAAVVLSKRGVLHLVVHGRTACWRPRPAASTELHAADWNFRLEDRCADCVKQAERENWVPVDA